MHIPIKSPKDLGLIIRASRRIQKLRLDDVSGSAGVGHVFTRDVEHGKETVQLGRVMKLLEELGIELLADMPDEAMAELARLQATGLRPLKRRADRASAMDGEK
ncbi:MAG: transcriptional regulator [Candidatus Thermoplasmatota archaeon]|nr:transcriptional regulator [Candidatus Thermoplasmatota archaeon]MCL5060617.1 transcriptional regulator [Candidatus Thermoplasmatota archaeon]